LNRLEEASRSPSAVSTISIALGAVALCVAAAAVSLAESTAPADVLWAVVGVGTIAMPVGVGLYLWHREPRGRIGVLLVVAGYAWFLPALSHSGQEMLYSVGRISAWPCVALLIYLFLAYPSGRLSSATDRLLVRVMLGVLLILYMPTLFLVDEFPTPSPFVICGQDCPENAFQLTGSEPGFVETVVGPLRDVLLTGVWLVALGSIGLRLKRATPLEKKTLGPVLAAAGVGFAAGLAYVVLRRAGAGDAALAPFALVYMLMIPTASIGFLIGLLQRRLYTAGALERLAIGLGDAGDPERLRALIADALGDPSLELYYCAPGRPNRWVDSDGHPREVPAAAEGRLLEEVRSENETVALIDCDQALDDQRHFLGAVCACARSALGAQQMTAALRASHRDLEASRSRLAAATAMERQRIERDLHDSAQQQLVTLRVRLELAAERLAADPSAGAELLRELGPEIDEIVDGIRSLARNIYPPLLAESGLDAALRSAALRASVPVSVSAKEIARHPIEIESAVYFCCLEAMQNAAKHADGLSRVSVSVVEDDRRLRFEVADDGCGLPASTNGDGAGLTNMRDRLAAVRGVLVLDSAPGLGTTVRGTIPLG
jgi:signal transduction histidine kinase